MRLGETLLCPTVVGKARDGLFAGLIGRGEMVRLNGRQIRFLRAQGHHLAPVVMVGRDGITPTVLASLNANLAAHELVKVKVQQNCPLERREAAALLAAQAPAALVQVLGRTVLLFRPNPDLPADRRLRLP